MLFKNYEYFLAITESRNLSQAAEKLFISQPSLSKYLQRLEKNLGVELFNHHSSPLKLTYAGERYLEYINKVSELDKQLQKEFSDIHNHERGIFTLGMPIWRSSCMLPQFLPLFSNRYPNIEVNVIEGKSDFLVNELLKDRLDICIMNPLPNMDYNNLDLEIILEEKILLAVNKNHPSLQKIYPNGIPICPNNPYPAFDISNIENEQFFLTKTGQNLTVTIAHFFSQQHFHPTCVFETENLSTAINLAAAGMGYTFIPEAGVLPTQIPRDLVLFTVGTPPLQWPLAMFFKSSSYVTQATQHFIDILCDLYHK